MNSVLTSAVIYLSNFFLVAIFVISAVLIDFVFCFTTVLFELQEFSQISNLLDF